MLPEQYTHFLKLYIHFTSYICENFLKISRIKFTNNFCVKVNNLHPEKIKQMRNNVFN